MPSKRVQRIKSIVQNTDNQNGGGMKKQGGPVTTGNTHTYWKPTLSRTIIAGKSTGNNEARFNARTYAVVAFDAIVTSTQDFAGTTVIELSFTGTLNDTTNITGLTFLAGDANANLAVGQQITGTGIPAGTTIEAIVSGTEIRLSAATTAGTGGDLKRTANVIQGINVAADTEFTVGQTVTGTGISHPVPTTIIKIIDSNNILLSADATGTEFKRPGSNTITNIANVTGNEKLVIGHVVSGTGIPAGTTITSLPSTTTATLSHIGTTTGNINLTAAASDTIQVTDVNYGNIYVGQTVTGTGIPANTKISSFGTGKGNVGTYVLDKSPTLSQESIGLKGEATESWKNYGKTYSSNVYRPFNLFGFGTGYKNAKK